MGPPVNELILCRDPFNWVVRTQLSDGTLLFGSSKGVQGASDFSAKPDVTALAVRLAYEYPLDQTTLFLDVTSVGMELSDFNNSRR